MKKNFIRALYKIIQIELDDSENQFLSPSLYPIRQKQMIREEPMLLENSILREDPISMEEIFTPQKAHISSPLPNEEFIIPLTIDDKTSDRFTFTPNKRNRKIRTHKNYKIFKHKKPSTRSKTSRKSKVLSNKLFSLL
jgi:hypothetical protein